jgi:methylamine dehydrogenase light chain
VIELNQRLASRFDTLFERMSRGFSRSLSRRHFLSRLGTVVAGGAALPLLPVARAAAEEPFPTQNGEPPQDTPEGNPLGCDYWRYCAIDGFLCGCCGGSHSSCPPGTEMSAVTWLGTCQNPEDGRDYVISYNDCCGRDLCGRCFCNRNEGDRPIYSPTRSNDINWCVGTTTQVYNCSVALVVGVAAERQPER